MAIGLHDISQDDTFQVIQITSVQRQPLPMDTSSSVFITKVLENLVMKHRAFFKCQIA